jgi:hypothetical protein
MNLEDEGVNISYMLAGLFGSLMMMSKTAGMNIGRTILATIGGAASANYLTPLVLDITKWGHGAHSHAIAFLIGFAGLRGIEWLTSKFMTLDEPVNTNKRRR